MSRRHFKQHLSSAYDETQQTVHEAPWLQTRYDSCPQEAKNRGDTVNCQLLETYDNCFLRVCISLYQKAEVSGTEKESGMRPVLKAREITLTCIVIYSHHSSRRQGCTDPP